MKKAIVTGSFDPVTLGHIDIIKRAAKEYDEVYAVIFTNPDKSYTFDLSERMQMLILATEDIDNCLASFSNGLVIDYMREHGIKTIVRGYRNETDLAYEKEMAEWNYKHSGYETVMLKCDEALKDVSSSLVREKILKGEPLEDFLSKNVITFIQNIDK
jgi:pantetheine-phosphate adenylyltransferase